MNDWTNGYIVGPYEALKQWELDKWPPVDGSGLPSKPGGLVSRWSPCGVLEESGKLDELGNPIYINDDEDDSVLVLISIRKGLEPELEDLRSLDGVNVYLDVSKDEIAELYPKFTVGQSIPHVSAKTGT